MSESINTVKLFLVSGKEIWLSVDENERKDIIEWLQGINTKNPYIIKQVTPTDMTYVIYREKITHAIYY